MLDIKYFLGSKYNYDDAIDGKVGTNYYDFYSYTVGNFLLTGKAWITNNEHKRKIVWFTIILTWPMVQIFAL